MLMLLLVLWFCVLCFCFWLLALQPDDVLAAVSVQASRAHLRVQQLLRQEACEQPPGELLRLHESLASSLGTYAALGAGDSRHEIAEPPHEHMRCHPHAGAQAGLGGRQGGNGAVAMANPPGPKIDAAPRDIDVVELEVLQPPAQQHAGVLPGRHSSHVPAATNPGTSSTDDMHANALPESSTPAHDKDSRDSGTLPLHDFTALLQISPLPSAPTYLPTTTMPSAPTYLPTTTTTMSASLPSIPAPPAPQPAPPPPERASAAGCNTGESRGRNGLSSEVHRLRLQGEMRRFGLDEEVEALLRDNGVKALTDVLEIDDADAAALGLKLVDRKKLGKLRVEVERLRAARLV